MAKSLARDKACPRLLRVEGSIHLHGVWTLAALRPRLLRIRRQLTANGQAQVWDLSQVTRLDAFGALLLWRTWGEQYPQTLSMPGHLASAFERIAHAPVVPEPRAPRLERVLTRFGRALLAVADHLRGLVEMVGHLCEEFARLPLHPREIPWRETSAAFHKDVVTALPIAALLGFLIGIVLAYLSALQLQNFGAETFLINILGLGVIRELGPVLVSVLVAGRSGSAITAQIGVMRVTEEIDALAAMGVSRYQRLILPKVLGLTLGMPLLVAWTSAMAMLGGSFSAWMQLNIDLVSFFERLPSVVPVANIGIGLAKGGVFGLAIALIACHYGMRVKPNTESLSVSTTTSVVASITMVILLDAVFAILTRSIGVAQ